MGECHVVGSILDCMFSLSLEDILCPGKNQQSFLGASVHHSWSCVD